MKDVVHVKLITGEEIIGKANIDRNMPDGMAMERVRTLAVQPMGQGQMGIAMIPYMVGNPDGLIWIKREHIIAEPESVPKNLEDSYLQQVSGLTFATANQGAIQT